MAASRLQLPPGPWLTVLDGLCARFPRIPREVWLDRFARGRVQDATGSVLDVATPYRVGMEVRYFREVLDEPRIPFEAKIVFADADLVVADKPHFLPVLPAGRFVVETLLSRLQARFENPALVPVHRIDRETAGLVMFSARIETRDRYQNLFRQRAVEKHYEAIAPPLPDLVMPHVRSSRLQAGKPFFLMCEADGAPNSHTRIDVIERRAHGWRYALQPETGRKHQLRVHMAALGAPIVNDSLYPTLQVRSTDDYSRPLQLLAKSLRFVDPISGKPRAFESRQGLTIALPVMPASTGS
ncbi:MAG: pseudouridine synthase [Pseudomonadota bacterium]|nr:pseudouridine synthase [Pseudomonadota bacterium]MDQ3159993.1 pseudouridine synthase [Pseudomonadota bacterium]